MRSLREMLPLVLVAFAIGACDYYVDKAGAETPPPVTSTTKAVVYQDIHDQLMKPFCLRCHSGDNAAGGYSFESYERTMDVVTPGDSAKSLLCDAILQGYMPPRGQKPSAELAKMVCDWIDSGAAEK